MITRLKVRMPDLPVEVATAVLLHLARLRVDMAVFGKEAREVVFVALVGSVVTVIGLVRASHDGLEDVQEIFGLTVRRRLCQKDEVVQIREQM